MATSTTYQVKVQALWDNDQLKRGSSEAETAIENLAREFSTTTDKIQADLDTIDTATRSTFGSGGSFDRSVDDVETSGNRLKETGSEIGAEFAENMGEGFRSGDWSGVVLETFTSLGPALGVAGIGLGIGAAMLNGMVRGAQQAKQEFYDAVNSIFTSLEVRAGQSADQIQADILKGFTFESVLTELGGEGGFQAGLEKVDSLVRETGADFNEIVDILRGDINPQNRDTLALLRDISKETEIQGRSRYGQVSVLTDTAQKANDILEATRKTRDEQEGGLKAAERYRDYAWETADAQGRIAADAERYAAALQRAADNFSRMYGRELPYGVYPG